jgi:hypothetical protein
MYEVLHFLIYIYLRYKFVRKLLMESTLNSSESVLTADDLVPLLSFAFACYFERQRLNSSDNVHIREDSLDDYMRRTSRETVVNY